MTNTDKVMIKMIEFDKGDAKRIQHFIKVHSFAHIISIGEKLNEDITTLIEVSAILHDIGIHPSEEKYGDCNGKHQEELGTFYAKQLLKELDLFNEEFIDRVCFLISKHHTYNNDYGIEHRILIEADFLVNAFEDNLSKEAIIKGKENIFKTKTGLNLANTLFI